MDATRQWERKEEQRRRTRYHARQWFINRAAAADVAVRFDSIIVKGDASEGVKSGVIGNQAGWSAAGKCVSCVYGLRRIATRPGVLVEIPIFESDTDMGRERRRSLSRFAGDASTVTHAGWSLD